VKGSGVCYNREQSKVLEAVEVRSENDARAVENEKLANPPRVEEREKGSFDSLLDEFSVLVWKPEIPAGYRVAVRSLRTRSEFYLVNDVLLLYY